MLVIFQIVLTVALAIFGILGGWLKCYEEGRVTAAGWTVMLAIVGLTVALLILSKANAPKFRDLEVANETLRADVAQIDVLNRSGDLIRIDAATWRVPSLIETAQFYEQAFDPPVEIPGGDMHRFNQNVAPSGRLSPELPFVLSLHTTRGDWIHRILDVHDSANRLK